LLPEEGDVYCNKTTFGTDKKWYLTRVGL